MKSFPTERYEKRVPMSVAVQIAGHSEVPGVEMTFTENVSSRGARVYTSRRWDRDDMLVVGMLRGNFRSPARVAYCERQADNYIIGLEFLQPQGKWVVEPTGPL